MLLNADCEHKQESTENIRGSNTLPCRAYFYLISPDSRLDRRTDICRRKKNPKPLMWIYLCLPLPSRETFSVREVHSVCLFFLLHCPVFFFFFFFWVEGSKCFSQNFSKDAINIEGLRGKITISGVLVQSLTHFISPWS